MDKISISELHQNDGVWISRDSVYFCMIGCKLLRHIIFSDASLMKRLISIIVSRKQDLSYHFESTRLS